MIVGHWGNLAAVKGVALLAEAAGRARRAADIEVRFFGRVVDDELAARLPGLAGAARVELRGVFEPEDLPEMTADLDCAAFPSLAFETHSLVLDEALAAGLPVVVSDRGAPAERVGERGLAVPAGDVGALAAALDRMADPEERERFGRGAPAPLRGRGDWATEIEGILADAVLRASEAGPAEVRDFTRDRLAFRNERLREIEVFVGALHARRADLESALRGDAAALDRVERESPDLGAMIRARGTNGE